MPDNPRKETCPLEGRSGARPSCDWVACHGHAALPGYGSSLYGMGATTESFAKCSAPEANAVLQTAFMSQHH